jgi:hypothetical protein
MKKEGKLDKNIKIRVPESLANLIAVKAKEQRCTDSDIMRDALNDYLFKGIHDEELLFSHVSAMKRSIEAVDRKADLLSRLFIFWLRYYFTYAPQLPSGKEEKKTQIKIGEQRKKVMLEEFKKDIQENPSLMERLVLEFFEFEQTEGGV